MSRSRSIFGLAGLALALGAHGTGLGGAMTGPAVADDLPAEPRFRRVRRGPAPKPSKPLPEGFRRTVQAQRGFTTNRLVSLRRTWVKQSEAERKIGRNTTPWPTFLDQNRRSLSELQFAPVA